MKESLDITMRSPFLTTAESLLAFCELSPDNAPYGLSTPRFPVRVPTGFAGKIIKGDWLDPLLLQVLPRSEEGDPPPEHYGSDPVGDTGAQVACGLLHKYHGRALLLATSTCAINCRYCFRRAGRCEALPQDGSRDDEVLSYLKSETTVQELVLSGGDPLLLSTMRLKRLVSGFATISHIKTIRFHSRIPAVLPSRITPGLLRLFSSAAQRFSCITVIHVNHPREIDNHAIKVLLSMRAAGMLLLNQSVLLKGINDSAQTLGELSERLTAAGVVPYYLHQLDRVCGAHHFEVEEKTGASIINRMRTEHPGYAVPRYVREVPGAPGKIPL